MASDAERIADRVVSLQQTAVAKIDTLKHAAAQKAEGVASATSTGLCFALLGLGLSLAAAVLGAASAGRSYTGAGVGTVRDEATWG